MTIEQALNMIPDAEIKNKAIHNAEKQNMLTGVTGSETTVGGVLASAFNFKETSEGRRFWQSKVRKYDSVNLNPRHPHL